MWARFHWPWAPHSLRFSAPLAWQTRPARSLIPSCPPQIMNANSKPNEPQKPKWTPSPSFPPPKKPPRRSQHPASQTHHPNAPSSEPSHLPAWPLLRGHCSFKRSAVWSVILPFFFALREIQRRVFGGAGSPVPSSSSAAFGRDLFRK